MSRLRAHAADIARCDGYAWNLRDKLGKGSYGDVYRGWNNKETVEVAVKVVRKDLFKQDIKAEQNLRREIELLFKLKSCEYVVGLYHVEDMKRSNCIVMVMELCECDLDHLLKIKSFGDNDITLLLYQLGEGMKSLKARNIVHRDIKPGNILVKYHPVTGKMMLKLADFGFARYFTDEAEKPIDLQSMAGTPVFMAPEALRCVFNHGREHYDEKVDLWSIGALVYKVIVGQCGFYAQLQHILHILNKKGDAIGWEPGATVSYNNVPKAKFIYELPPEVDDRLSPPYKQKMNELLVALLKLDPNERMTFDEFFDFIDDLMKNKVEIVNLLHGNSIKFMMEPGMKMTHLMGDIQAATGEPVESQIIFSAQSDLYLNVNSKLTDAEFNIFMNRSGGSQGHALLYFIPVSEIMTALIEPDYGVISKLYFIVESKAQCTQLILEHKMGKDVVHSISVLQKQMERQFSCIREFRSFCTRQLELLNEKLGDTRQTAQQTLTRVTLAAEWLTADINTLDSNSSQYIGEYRQKVKLVQRMKREIEDTIADLDVRMESCETAITRAPSLEINDILDNAQKLFEKAKDLPKTNRDFLYNACEELFSLCKGLIVSSSERAHKMLSQLYTALTGIWEVTGLVDQIREKKRSLDDMLQNSVPKWRSELLKKLSERSSSTPPAQVAAVMEAADTDNLTRRLKDFCISAKRIVDPTSKPPSSPNSQRKMYPDVPSGSKDGYLMPNSSFMPDTLEALLPEATLQLQKLEPKLQRVHSTVGKGEVSVKITVYNQYEVGDVVMFHPVGKPQTKLQLNLLHLNKPQPLVLLHRDSYPGFQFRYGKIADLVIARITRPLQEMKFKDDLDACSTAGEPKESTKKFYYVWAEPTGLDFPRHRAPLPSAEGPGKHEEGKKRLFGSNDRKFV